MASPQKENGYTAISNELLDALSRIRIPGESRQVLDVIIRKTYGFNKKYDCISNSQFVKYTGIKKQHVSRAVAKLKNMNIIYVKSEIGSDKVIHRPSGLKQKSNGVIHRLSTIKDKQSQNDVKKDKKSVTNMGTNSKVIHNSSKVIHRVTDSKQKSKDKSNKVINNSESVTIMGTSVTNKGTWKTASYYINKDYESWLSISKKTQKKVSNQYGVQKGTNRNHYGGTQKKRYKDNIYIDNSSNEKTKEKAEKVKDIKVVNKDTIKSSNVIEIKEYFMNVFNKKFSRPYRFLLKETNKIKELLNIHEKDVILDLIDLFFEETETNAWLKERCNFSMFNHKVNDLIIKLSSMSGI